MGHIKEPKGVDFIIESTPLIDEERKAISEFIRKDKENFSANRTITKSTKPEQIKKHIRQQKL